MPRTWELRLLAPLHVPLQLPQQQQQLLLMQMQKLLLLAVVKMLYMDDMGDAARWLTSVGRAVLSVIVFSRSREGHAMGFRSRPMARSGEGRWRGRLPPVSIKQNSNGGPTTDRLLEPVYHGVGQNSTKCVRSGQET